MKILSIITLLLVTFHALGMELKEGVDPITNQKYTLKNNKVGVWDVYTLPDNSEYLVLVAKNKKPVMSASQLGSGSTISIHDPKNSSLTSVDVYDRDNDGVYDRIIIYQQDGSNGFVEAKLIQGRWSYKEHKPNEK